MDSKNEIAIHSFEGDQNHSLTPAYEYIDSVMREKDRTNQRLQEQLYEAGESIKQLRRQMDEEKANSKAVTAELHRKLKEKEEELEKEKEMSMKIIHENKEFKKQRSLDKEEIRSLQKFMATVLKAAENHKNKCSIEEEEVPSKKRKPSTSDSRSNQSTSSS